MSKMNNVIPLNYQGAPVQFNADGWLHATEIARRFNRRPVDWLHLPETVGYLVALAKAIGALHKCGIFEQLKQIKELDTSKASTQAKILRLAKDTGLIITRAGSPETGGGTWLHPKLAVAFARWLDVDFAVWCDLHIDALLRGELDEQRRFNQACAALANRQKKASMSASDLAKWRWRKPGLERELEYRRNQLQMMLGLEA